MFYFYCLQWQVSSIKTHLSQIKLAISKVTWESIRIQTEINQLNQDEYEIPDGTKGTSYRLFSSSFLLVHWAFNKFLKFSCLFAYRLRIFLAFLVLRFLNLQHDPSQGTHCFFSFLPSSPFCQLQTNLSNKTFVNIDLKVRVVVSKGKQIWSFSKKKKKKNETRKRTPRKGGHVKALTTNISIAVYSTYIRTKHDIWFTWI